MIIQLISDSPPPQKLKLFFQFSFRERKVFSLLFIFLLFLLYGCKENIDTSSRYVFKTATVASYLKNKPQFSLYVDFLKRVQVSQISQTSVFQLLTAYGHYTCFAPTNTAIQLYLDTLYQKGIVPSPLWDTFQDTKLADSLRTVIVMNSIIDGTSAETTYQTSDFPKENEEFQLSTMADNKLGVNYSPTNPDSLYVGNSCMISVQNRDILASNGVIHEVDNVINPSDETLGTQLERFSADFNSGLSVMAKLVVACRLCDTLKKVRDESYERLRVLGIVEDINTPVGWGVFEVPDHRKFGFTLFAPHDQFWMEVLNKSAVDISVDDIRRWLVDHSFYPDAKDDMKYWEQDNVVNQFVTYHLLPMRIPPDKLVIHYNEKGYNYRAGGAFTIPVWAHYVTMGKRRLLRIWESKESGGVYLNRFPVLNNERHGDYHEKSCDAANEGVLVNTERDAGVKKYINGIIYPISRPVTYDIGTRSNLLQRIRYDFFDLLPEMMNNGYRAVRVASPSFLNAYFPPDEVYPYFEDLSINSKDTYCYFLSGLGSNWPNYQGDEVNVQGIYDITLRLPPVPISSTYEIRMGVSTHSSTRGICQIYFGEDKSNLVPEGIPVDMSMGGKWRNVKGVRFPSIVGWEEDIDDDDYNAEVDKKMRNNGFMKAPEYFCEVPGSLPTGRALEKTTRRIIVRRHMDADKTYYLRFKTVQDDVLKQLFIDYLEWCPKEIYDNPEIPEDIW